MDDPLNYSTPSIVERIAAGKIKTVGNNAKANVEALITLKPSVVLTYASGDPTFDGIDKLQQAGLTVVVEGSSQEQTPLGRAEWTKLIGLLTNREKTAQTAYARLRTDYRTLAAKASVSPNKPGVIVGSMFAGTWYMPGGKSFPAQLVRDAGGSYAWSTDGSTGSLALDYEAVVEKAYDATVWINAGYQWANLNSVTAEDPRYARLTPYKVGNVWGNDRRVNATGGSDYFETAVVRPDLVLADLVAVLHPELVPGHEPVFYRHIPRAR